MNTSLSKNSVVRIVPPHLTNYIWQYMLMKQNAHNPVVGDVPAEAASTCQLTKRHLIEILARTPKFPNSCRTVEDLIEEGSLIATKLYNQETGERDTDSVDCEVSIPYPGKTRTVQHCDFYCFICHGPGPLLFCSTCYTATHATCNAAALDSASSSATRQSACFVCRELAEFQSHTQRLTALTLRQLFHALMRRSTAFRAKWSQLERLGYQAGDLQLNSHFTLQMMNARTAQNRVEHGWYFLAPPTPPPLVGAGGVAQLQIPRSLLLDLMRLEHVCAVLYENSCAAGATSSSTMTMGGAASIGGGGGGASNATQQSKLDNARAVRSALQREVIRVSSCVSCFECGAQADLLRVCDRLHPVIMAPLSKAATRYWPFKFLRGDVITTDSASVSACLRSSKKLLVVKIAAAASSSANQQSHQQQSQQLQWCCPANYKPEWIDADACQEWPGLQACLQWQSEMQRPGPDLLAALDNAHAYEQQRLLCIRERERLARGGGGGAEGGVKLPPRLVTSVAPVAASDVAVPPPKTKRKRQSANSVAGNDRATNAAESGGVSLRNSASVPTLSRGCLTGEASTASTNKLSGSLANQIYPPSSSSSSSSSYESEEEKNGKKKKPHHHHKQSQLKLNAHTHTHANSQISARKRGAHMQMPAIKKQNSSRKTCPARNPATANLHQSNNNNTVACNNKNTKNASASNFKQSRPIKRHSAAAATSSSYTPKPDDSPVSFRSASVVSVSPSSDDEFVEEEKRPSSSSVTSHSLNLKPPISPSQPTHSPSTPTPPPPHQQHNHRQHQNINNSHHHHQQKRGGVNVNARQIVRDGSGAAALFASSKRMRVQTPHSARHCRRSLPEQRSEQDANLTDSSEHTLPMKTTHPPPPQPIGEVHQPVKTVAPAPTTNDLINTEFTSSCNSSNRSHSKQNKSNGTSLKNKSRPQSSSYSSLSVQANHICKNNSASNQNANTPNSAGSAADSAPMSSFGFSVAESSGSHSSRESCTEHESNAANTNNAGIYGATTVDPPAPLKLKINLRTLMPSIPTNQ